MEPFSEGYLDDGPRPVRSPVTGFNGLQSAVSTDGLFVTVNLMRFGRKYRFWSFWNTEGLSRMAFRDQAESVVRAKLVLES